MPKATPKQARGKARPVKIIRFTKIKQWYVPADVETYRILHKHKLPEVRYHEDFFPTLQLLTSKVGIRAQLVPFSDIWAEFTHNVTEAWTRNPKRKMVATSKQARFESRDMKRARKTFPELEACLRRFFKRWGFTAEFNYSESPTRAKLVVDFALDGKKHPIIEFIKD